MKKLLIGLFLLLSWAVFGQSSIQKNYFTTNDNPALSITNGNLISTNIYVSNIFATNITVQNITNINEFRGRTTITTNLFVTNSLIQYLTNNYFYTTNVTEQFVTNQLSYITNLYGPFITNNTLYSTNIYVTNLTANFITNDTSYITNLYVTNLSVSYITNNTSYITNLYSSNIFTTNLYATNIYTTNLYSSNIFTTNLFATNIYTTNLYSSNIFTTNLYATNIFTTNLYSSNIFTTNLYTSNLFATNIYTTNLYATNIYNSNLFSTNIYVSNIFTTNITLMEAIWATNKWNGPTNDVSFKATYQKFVASTDMEITGLIDASATNANTSVVLLDPGGATRTLYFPDQFTNYTSDGNNAYIIPKTNIATVTLFQYANQNTNVVVRLFGPGTSPSVGYWASNHNILYPGSSSNPSGTTNYVWIGGTNNQVTFPVAMFAVTNYVTNTQSASEVILNGVAGTNLTSDSYISGFDVYQFDLGTSMGNSANVFFSTHVGNHGGTTSVIGGGPSAYGLDSYMNVDNGSSLLSGSANSVQGFLTGDQSFSLGVSGIAAGLRNNSTNMGTSGEGILNTGGKAVGLFGEVVKVANFQTPPVIDSGALVLDTFDTGLPLIVARTNNGTQVASLDASGLWNASGFVDGTLTGTNFFSGYVQTSTNLVWGPDFSVPESLLSTNAAFTMVACAGVDPTKKTVQWTLVNVTNTTAAAVAITGPPNVHMVGTWYVTNWTAIWFQCYANAITNGYAIPTF